jgi:hypothetical protein
MAYNVHRGGIHPHDPPRPEREPLPTGKGEREVTGMKRTRIEKPKPRHPRELEPALPLDPRDPDVVRVKRGSIWRYADRRWAA